MKTQEPKTLQQAIAYFSEYENCHRFMVELRWPDGKVSCPRCGSEDVKWLPNARVFKCYQKHEKQKFSLKVGTIFEDSAIPLEKWLVAVWLMVNCKNGISSYEIHRDLGITQKSAWFMAHRIRMAMKNESLAKLGSEGGPVETDETFVGAKHRFMHKSRLKKMRQAQNPKVIPSENPYTNKTVVFGMLDREARKVRAMVIPNVKRATLQEKILENIKGGSTVYTDEYPAYKLLLAQDFVHDYVNHMEGYVKGQVHTNGIENFWSLLKRGLRGTYVAVEPFHLDRYIDEQVFRFNNRATKDNPLNDSDRFTLAMHQIVGKRLTYQELTGKTQDGQSQAF
jgi:transposase-like protein